jgi:probable F420-dependent oxidoreductase
VKLDYQSQAENLEDVPRIARNVESSGYDGFWTAETKHDPFLPHVLAAEHTEHIELGTGIAVAFARNPMNLAHTGWDLQAHSGGRFILGLGSQIKPHIRLRFSMEWSRPAARMRELIEAIRTIWACWNEGVPLRFRGEFYTHTLMTPFFDPGPNPHGNPKIFVAAVGREMTRVTGAVADGLLTHPFTTERYVRDVTLPTLTAGAATAGRSVDEIELGLSTFVVTGSDDADMAACAAEIRRQIAFYGSTPSYRPVLEHHGWGELQRELGVMSKRGEWDEMAALIDDEILETFAVVGAPDQIATEIRRRFGDLADRISLYPRLGGHRPEVIETILAELVERR